MFARDEYLTMKIPSIAQVLVYTAAIGGIGLFWANFTIKTWSMVSRLTDKMFVEEGGFAEEEYEEEAERQVPN